MAMTTHLDIVSATEMIFSGLAEKVTCTGSLGELGIAQGHAPLLTQLRPGTVTVRQKGGEEEIYYVSGGMLEVQPNTVTILADTALQNILDICATSLRGYLLFLCFEFAQHWAKSFLTNCYSSFEPFHWWGSFLFHSIC